MAATASKGVVFLSFLALFGGIGSAATRVLEEEATKSEEFQGISEIMYARKASASAGAGAADKAEKVTNAKLVVLSMGSDSIELAKTQLSSYSNRACAIAIGRLADNVTASVNQTETVKSAAISHSKIWIDTIVDTRKICAETFSIANNANAAAAPLSPAPSPSPSPSSSSVADEQSMEIVAARLKKNFNTIVGAIYCLINFS